MSLFRLSRGASALLLAVYVFAGAFVFSGCGEEGAAPVGKPGGAPVDNDDAARQKAMQDFMEKESKKK